MIDDWQHLTSPELAERTGPDVLAVMALGAIEQHGPHLPLSTDLDIAMGLQAAALARLDTDLKVLVLPPMALGASQEHAGFAGTLSLTSEQMSAQLRALGASLAAAGMRRLVLINAHGGNIGWLGPAALDLRVRYGMLVVKANYMLLRPPAHVLAAEELRHGLHGGQAETAMMLHLHPERVRSGRLDHFRSCAEELPDTALLGPEGEAAWAWRAEDLNPQGVVGDARGASAEMGRDLVDYYADRLARIMREAAGMNLDGFAAESTIF